MLGCGQVKIMFAAVWLRKAWREDEWMTNG